MVATRNRRNRNRPGPTHGTAGICTPGTRLPGYPSCAVYGGHKTGVYVDLNSGGCASRLAPLAPADYSPRKENTPIYACLAYHTVAPKLRGEQICYGNPGTPVPRYPCPPYHAAAQRQKGGRIVYGNPGTRLHGCSDTRVRLIRAVA